MPDLVEPEPGDTSGDSDNDDDDIDDDNDDIDTSENSDKEVTRKTFGADFRFSVCFCHIWCF